MTSFTESSVASTTFWIGKPSTHKLWQNINDYVSDYTAEYQAELQSEWFRKWYFLINDIKIGDKSREFQVIALSLTSNPDASIKDCINAAFDLIPNLREHFTILEINADKGTYKCKMDKCTFTTPKEKLIAKSPTRPTTKQTTNVNSNRYASLQVDDDEPLDSGIGNDDMILSDMKLPHVGNDVILEQHSASTISEMSKVVPINIQEEFTAAEKPSSNKSPNITDYASPFSRFRNNTTNALRKVAFKAQDFAADKDFKSMLQNNPILNSVKLSPVVNEYEEINVQKIQNDELRNDINMLQTERRNMNAKFKEIKSFVETLD